MYAICMLHVCYMYAICMLHVCYMYAICMIYVCYMYAMYCCIYLPVCLQRLLLGEITSFYPTFARPAPGFTTSAPEETL